MPTLPQLDIKTNSNHSPHVTILGAGASLAALPDGDKNGRKLPLMNNLVEVVGLESLFEEYGLKYEGENFEATYDALVFSGECPDLVK